MFEGQIHSHGREFTSSTKQNGNNTRRPRRPMNALRPMCPFNARKAQAVALAVFSGKCPEWCAEIALTCAPNVEQS